MPQRKNWRTTTHFLRWPGTVSSSSTASIAAGGRTNFFSSTVRAAGMRGTKSGWATNGSAASSTISMRCSAGEDGKPSRKSSAISTRCRVSPTSSRSIRTRSYPTTPRVNWSARWRIRSIVPCMTRSMGGWWTATRFCNRASPSASPAWGVHVLPECSRAIPALIPTHARCRMCIRISFGKVRSSAREFTMWTPSSTRSAESFLRTAS